MSVTDGVGFAGFDAEVVHEGYAHDDYEQYGHESVHGVALSGDLADDAAGAEGAGSARTAVDIGLGHGAPLEVMTEFLAALGLGAETIPQLLLDFDAEDLTAARRGFMVGGLPATPLHKATVTSWLRHVTAELGPRPPSILDPGFAQPVVAATAPPPRRVLAAPAAPADTLPLLDHGRAAPPALGLSAHVPLARRAMDAQPAPPVVALPMRDVIDQTHQGLFVLMSDGEVEEAWKMHARLTGLPPRPESEPSVEQLAALRTKLRAGEAPAVDFAVWGPFDRRHAKDRRTLGLVFVEAAPGQPSLQPRTLHGPGCFSVWERHWGVFSTAMLALGACAPGPLQRYRDGIADLHTLYGPGLWGLIMRADETMRGEQWRRMASADPPGGDWSAIIAASAFFEEGSRQWWWEKNVCKPAEREDRPTAALEVVNSLEGFSPRCPAQAPAAAPAARGAEPPWKKARRGGGGARREQAAAAAPAAFAAAPAQPAAPAVPTAPPRGRPGGCFAFNAGRCSGVNEVCPGGFAHICIICGDSHAAARTPGCREKVDEHGRPKSGQKGRGKGARGKGRGAGQ